MLRSHMILATRCALSVGRQQTGFGLITSLIFMGTSYAIVLKCKQDFTPTIGLVKMTRLRKWPRESRILRMDQWRGTPDADAVSRSLSILPVRPEKPDYPILGPDVSPISCLSMHVNDPRL